MTQQPDERTAAETLISIKRQLGALARRGVTGLDQVRNAIDDLVVEKATPEELDEILAENATSTELDQLLAGKPADGVA